MIKLCLFLNKFIFQGLQNKTGIVISVTKITLVIVYKKASLHSASELSSVFLFLYGNILLF